eukprot:COSAG02_NODE_90_length_37755_cov_29.833364_15_plen_85_part_00
MAEGGGRGPPVCLSTFQQRCFALVRRIPAGKVSTYGAVAAALAEIEGTEKSKRVDPLATSVLPSWRCCVPRISTEITLVFVTPP